jgi:hypothetical protein
MYCTRILCRGKKWANQEADGAGSAPITYRSRSGACFFRHWLTRCQKKFFSKVFFAYYFTSVFKDKKSKRSHDIAEIKVFLNFLLVDGRIRIRTKNNEGFYGSGSTTLLVTGYIP